MNLTIHLHEWLKLYIYYPYVFMQCIVEVLWALMSQTFFQEMCLRMYCATIVGDQ